MYASITFINSILAVDAIYVRGSWNAIYGPKVLRVHLSNVVQWQHYMTMPYHTVNLFLSQIPERQHFHDVVKQILVSLELYPRQYHQQCCLSFYYTAHNGQRYEWRTLTVCTYPIEFQLLVTIVIIPDVLVTNLITKLY